MEPEKKKETKIVLLGEKGVGKTSIANCWIHGPYCKRYPDGSPENMKENPTIGVTNFHKNVSIGDSTATITLWDTAGQEAFRSLAPIYTRSSSAAIIVASIDDQSSIESVRFWVELIKENCENDPFVFLAVNKIDMDIPYNKGEIMKQWNSLEYVTFVSAYTGEGIDELFECATQKAFQLRVERHEQLARPPPKKEDTCC